MKGTFRAVVFDFDGLILDTEMPIFVAWQEAFAEAGSELTVLEWAGAIGTVDGVDPLGLLHQRVADLLDTAPLEQRRRSRRDQLLLAEVVRPGVVAWLDEADRLDLAVAMASSSPVDWVEGHLTRLGLLDRFVHLSCFGDDRAAKPAPDLYLAACAALAVAPAEALAIEDSAHGVAAAKAAGLACVAVPNTLTGSLDLSAADVLLPSLADRSLTEVLADLSRAL